MDFLVELLIEVLGEFLSTLFDNIKNPKIRRWTLTVFYSVLGLGITALPAYYAVACWRENKIAGTVVLGLLAVAFFLFFCILVIRGHRKNW